MRALTPRSRLYVPGSTVLLVAGSLDQARLTFQYIRTWLEPTGQYRFLDSQTRVGITHTASNTKLRVMSSDSKRAFGIVGCPLIICDEPGVWEVTGRLERMFDAISDGARQTRLATSGDLPRHDCAVAFGMVATADCAWLWRVNVRDGAARGPAAVG